jgi:general secretion pathway protein A
VHDGARFSGSEATPISQQNMYTSFFGLSEKPFAITPNPRYLYMSERHAEALAHLLYGINEAGGFIQLTGEVGTGKTTVVRTLLEQMPAHADVAVILNPRLTPIEFLLTICEELGVFVRDVDEGSIKDLVDVLNKRLLAAYAKGRRIVVIVDEAQNLPAETLEQVRLLTNLETPTQKLLQIILIGQPELRELLQRADLRQLAQRITGRYHLEPLSREESGSYVKHRLKVAGSTAEVFSDSALREVHRLSGGIPRIINVVCDRALLGAYSADQHRVGPALIRRAAGEVYGHTVGPVWSRWAIAGATAVIVLISVFAMWQLFGHHDATTANTSTPAPGIATAAPQPAPAAAVVAPAAPVEPQTRDITALLHEYQNETTTEQAFARLLSLWGGKYEVDHGRPCEQATTQGFECVYQKGSWGQLRILNRPAILTLNDEDGTAHQIVVTTLQGDQAKVAIGPKEELVSISSLSRYWFGDYLLLWRPQVPGLKSLAVGMHGDEVRWLRRSLTSAQGQPPREPLSDYFDDELAQMVETFQRQHRLTADGIAGVQTQIVLDTLNNPPGAPLLTAQGG